MNKIKVLAIQFKYLGDAVILTPALKALTMQIPNIELHVLVAAEVAPLLENLPWISKVWAMPRQRGKVKLFNSLPFIRALRREAFNQSVDFGGNDRGALLSYLSGANIRLGSIDRVEATWLQRVCYTQIVKYKNPGASYFDLHFELLQAWKITRPIRLAMEINVGDIEIDSKLRSLSNNAIICHIATSQQKKDWPLSHWRDFFKLSHQSGLRLVFSAGPSEREKKMLGELKLMLPEAEMLPEINNLKIFLAVINNSRMFVSGDTGPLHFAEGLGVPVLGIFGVGNSVRQVAPMYSQDSIICADSCRCDLIENHAAVCQFPKSCMSGIQPEAVFFKLKSLL